jgi:hypothetical protein
MSIDAGRSVDWSRAGKRIRGGTVGVVVGAVAALVLAAPAWAFPTATTTLAPVGSGSYLLTLTNSGSETITNFYVTTGQSPTNVVPSPACNSTAVSEAVYCAVTLAPGASTQMCYTGPAATQVVLNGYYTVGIYGLSAAVGSCPLPGFMAGSPSGSGSGGKGAHAWTSTQCKSAYKTWSKGHHHATRSQQKAEANKLHKQHGCPLSALK